jgi:hypothetical protein
MTCESKELCAVSLFNGLTLGIRIYMRERMHEIENNEIGFVCGTHGMEDINFARKFGRKIEGLNQLRVPKFRFAV